jgi:oxaloacetate decarboxylase alpha subunit
VRKDLGYIALVTPTSQIVGSQAVLNVLMGERYKSITNETAGVLRGAYGSTPAPVNTELQARVLKDGEAPITGRPADDLAPEMDRLTAELADIGNERGLTLADAVVDDVLIYAMFPQVGLKFLENRGDTSAFEPPPWEIEEPQAKSAAAPTPAPASAGPESYRVEVNGKGYDVTVSPQGVIEQVSAAAPAEPAPAAAGGQVISAPLAGNIVRVAVRAGDTVAAGDVLVVLEAMKMETEVRAPAAGTVAEVHSKEGDAVALGAPLLTLG